MADHYLIGHLHKLVSPSALGQMAFLQRPLFVGRGVMQLLGLVKKGSKKAPMTTVCNSAYSCNWAHTHLSHRGRIKDYLTFFGSHSTRQRRDLFFIFFSFFHTPTTLCMCRARESNPGPSYAEMCATPAGQLGAHKYFLFFIKEREHYSHRGYPRGCHGGVTWELPWNVVNTGETGKPYATIVMVWCVMVTLRGNLIHRGYLNNEIKYINPYDTKKSISMNYNSRYSA